MLNGSLHGLEYTADLLSESPHTSEKMVLRPIGDWTKTSGWYLKDAILALHSMGLDLLRFCVVSKNGDESDIKLTSQFAIVKPG